MSNDDLRKLLASESPDAEALEELARRAERDESVRAELECAAGLSEFATHFKPLAQSSPSQAPGVSALVKHLASHPPEAPAPAPGEPATQLGHYTELTPIGHGGMGMVYRAFDTRLRRAVALKTLSPALNANAEARERFQREARAAAALDHPNILPIHAIETIDGRDVLVLDLNDGENLDAMIRRDGPLIVDELIRIGAAIADGLAAAHEAGIVHRDIKPANILLSADRSEIRIADFGLARVADDPALSNPANIAGTPHFISPEQARGEKTDARSDIFSLGATLYFAVTGSLPFAGSDTPAVLHAVTHDRQRPAHGAPEWLRAMLDAMLEKNPTRRPQTAAEVAAALRARSPRWSRQKWQRLALRAAAVVCLAACTAIAFTKWRDHRRDGDERLRAIAAKNEATPFVVSGRGAARFATINEALPALQDGDTLTIEAGGIYTVEMHRFGARSATIRGVKRRGIVLTSSGRNGSMFSTAARLRLENIAIVQPSGPADPAPIIIAEPGASVSLDHCRLTTPSARARTQGYGSVTSPMIVAKAPSQIELGGCIVSGRRSSLVEFATAGAAKLDLSNCGIGINALVRTGQSAPANADVAVRNCTVVTPMLALLTGSAQRLSLTGTRCFFDFFDAPIRAPGLTEEDLARILTWRGEGNAWHFSGGLTSFSRNPETRTSAPTDSSTLDQLRRMFPGSDADSFETAETMRARLSAQRLNPSIAQPADFALPENLAKRAPNIGVQSTDIGPE